MLFALPVVGGGVAPLDGSSRHAVSFGRAGHVCDASRIAIRGCGAGWFLVAERNSMVDLQVVGSAADHAHAVAPVNLVADASPSQPERILRRPRQSRTRTQSAWQVSSGLCSTHVRGRKTSPAGCSEPLRSAASFLGRVLARRAAGAVSLSRRASARPSSLFDHSASRPVKRPALTPVMAAAWSTVDTWAQKAASSSRRQAKTYPGN